VGSGGRPVPAVDVEQVHCRRAERRGLNRQGRSRRCRPMARKVPVASRHRDRARGARR
jgi:hypothetical protein